MRGVETMANNKKKRNTENNTIKKEIIVEREYTNEITPIQAILPIVIEDIKRRREEYIKAHPDKFNKK